MAIWEYAGKPVIGPSGALIECDECPCAVPCNTCDDIDSYYAPFSEVEADLAFTTASCATCNTLDNIYLMSRLSPLPSGFDPSGVLTLAGTKVWAYEFPSPSNRPCFIGPGTSKITHMIYAILCIGGDVFRRIYYRIVDTFPFTIVSIVYKWEEVVSLGDLVNCSKTGTLAARPDFSYCDPSGDAPYEFFV